MIMHVGGLTKAQLIELDKAAEAAGLSRDAFILEAVSAAISAASTKQAKAKKG